MLNKKIDDYLKKDYYPFHMPGHKRSKLLRNDLSYPRDFTEIEGFDNLNDPQDIFVKMEDKIAKTYKVEDAIISTNGSTCGILATIRALSYQNKKVLVQRSSHKAVYNAILINKLSPDYIRVKTSEIGAIKDIYYEDIKEKLKKNKYAFLLVTSPSYEGYKLDLGRIYNICRKYNTKLVVDMAHGSQFFLDDNYEANFDIAITSFHKNLSALTPAAAILINDKSLSKKLRKNMAIFQTSSPSYLILGSIDEMLENIGKFKDLRVNLSKNLDLTYNIDLSKLSIVDDINKDRSKILISTNNSNIDGNKLSALLRKEKIEVEMSYPSYCLLISTIFDTDEGFERLKKALVKIDKSLVRANKTSNFTYKVGKKIYDSYQVENTSFELIDLKDSCGRVSKEFIYAYPPGIPLICPGEKLDEDIINNIASLENESIRVNTISGQVSCIIDKSKENC